MCLPAVEILCCNYTRVPCWLPLGRVCIESKQMLVWIAPGSLFLALIFSYENYMILPGVCTPRNVNCISSPACALRTRQPGGKVLVDGGGGSLVFESRGTGTPFPSLTELQDHTYVLWCVVMKVFWSSSKLSSISWEFWMKDKFSSSISMKIDSSCWGSVKYSSGSWRGKHM